MQIVFFTHPAFQGSQSMPRFAKMLVDGMEARGHKTEMWTPQAFLFNLPVPASFKKWLGYMDQYIVFPYSVRNRLENYAPDTLFVFTDQALGPWIPLVAQRPHVIHCHDFLAQRSALGQISENPVSSTGKQYQNYIKKGYTKGKNFISVSEKTRQDLHQFLGFKPNVSAMVYNGINPFFNIEIDKHAAQKNVKAAIGSDNAGGYLLHVGGNQWYKNRLGVIKIYDAWRKKSDKKLPLVMIGAKPTEKLLQQFNKSPYRDDIRFLTGKSDDFVRQAYHGATALIFPSLAEGFGWPVAEAMACGCPVMTTGEAPLTEVGGTAAWYITRMQQNDDLNQAWANEAALILKQIVEMPEAERAKAIAAGFENIQKFNTDNTLDQIEELYKKAVSDC